MASLSGSRPLTVEQLLEAVEQLSPAERREFQHRLIVRQGENGESSPDEETLVRTALARLPAAAERRLRRLIARSEQGKLTPKELTEYRSLAQEAQRTRRRTGRRAGGFGPPTGPVRANREGGDRRRKQRG